MRKTILILMALLFPVAAVYGETLTLSTYYPAPFGSYDRLRLVPRTPAPTCNASLTGSIYFESTLMDARLCDGTIWGPLAGLWDQNVDDIYLVHPNAGTDYFVGIGDDTPDAVLEVAADNTAADLFMLSTDDGNDGDVMIVTGTGRVGIGEADPDATSAKVIIRGENSDNTTSSLLVEDSGGNQMFSIRDDGRVSIGQTGTVDSELEVDGTIDIEVAGRDSVVRFQETVGGAWYSMGIDRSDGGRFKINVGGSLGSPNQFRMTSTGDVTIRGSISLDDGTNVGEIQVEWVPDATKPGFYATYAP